MRLASMKRRLPPLLMRVFALPSYGDCGGRPLSSRCVDYSGYGHESIPAVHL